MEVMAIGNLMRGGTRVFGEPQQGPDGTVVIPVTRRRADGAGNDVETAVGVFAVRGGAAVWSPVVDADRIALIGVITGFVAATLGCIAVVRRPPWPLVVLHRPIRP